MASVDRSRATAVRTSLLCFPAALPPAPLAVALRRGRLPLRRCPRCRWRRWLFGGEAKSSEWNDGHAQACLEDHVQVPAPVASEPVSRRRSQPRRRRTDVPPLHPLRAAGGGSSAGRRSPRSGTTGTPAKAPFSSSGTGGPRGRSPCQSRWRGCGLSMGLQPAALAGMLPLICLLCLNQLPTLEGSIQHLH